MFLFEIIKTAFDLKYLEFLEFLRESHENGSINLIFPELNKLGFSVVVAETKV